MVCHSLPPFASQIQFVDSVELFHGLGGVALTRFSSCGA
jgi:hypothetical protein